jgi:hypothetical protein
MRIEFDGETETLTVNSVAIALATLETMRNPNLDRPYHSVSEGDVVIETQVASNPFYRIDAPPRVYETKVVTLAETKPARLRPRS